MSDILQAKTITGEYSGFADSALRAESANFYTTANESGFITGVDLTPYQLTADMTAYQPVGDYYSASNPSGFLTAHQSLEGYLQNTDLGITDNKITAISGVELSAGGDVPEGVMVESGLEYNSTMISGYSGSAFNDANLTDFVNTNSAAWGGSALPVSAGPGIKFEMVGDTLVASTDETVLFSSSPTTFTSAFTANETIANFDRIRVSQMIFTDDEYITQNHDYNTEGILLTNKMNVGFTYVIDNGWKCWGSEKYHITNGTDFTMARAGRNFIGPNTTAGLGFNDSMDGQNGWIYKVIGINRTAGE